MSKFHFQDGDRPLDGYTIEYALGRGGFGEVYFAVSDAGRQVALKSVQNYEEIELRGISHCMNLKSQHLVSIFDVKHGDDGMPWVIMEFVSGPSLRDILDESPGGLGPEKASYFVCELAKGLTYLHGAGVVHRDLKPHNVFFEEGVVKIGDYSLSKVITASHRSGHTMTVGTVHYMAPEISMGRYDKTVDIYALGVMLYEMLTGAPPYCGDSMGEVLMKHLSAEPDVSNIAEPFATVIRKAMQRDPADRYQSAEEMAAALKGVDGVAESMTGFGPASLSMVADHAARKARQESEVATDRVDAALTSTQREPLLAEQVEPNPMRQWGRDLGLFGYHAAVFDSRVGSESTLARDPLSPIWRWILAIATLPLMTIVGTNLTELVGTGSSPRVFGSLVGPEPIGVDEMIGILAMSVGVFLSGLVVRMMMRRGNLGRNGFAARLTHVFVAGAMVIAFISMFDVSLAVFSYANLVPVAVPLLIQNWSLLSAPRRPQRIRLAPVLFASAVAFVVAEMLGGNSMLSVAVMVGAGFALQVASAFQASNGTGGSGQGDRGNDRGNAGLAVSDQPKVDSVPEPAETLHKSNLLVAAE